jgi:hypothetical protein
VRNEPLRLAGTSPMNRGGVEFLIKKKEGYSME